jgi:hydrophobic/amphiphilic exporter-1 (mainly G- bacteria), HAE1 family
MNLSAPFIRRPVATTLVMLAILLFGVLGYRLLPVSDLPNVDFPTILVLASLPGAGPETMASAIATPLERQFSTIAGLSSMTSTSNQGSTQITLQFDLSRSLDAAAQDVQAMIAKAARDLPPEMPAPPSYQKVNPADQPVIYLALDSLTLPLSTVDEYAETVLGQQLSMVSGVAQVQVFGSQKYAVRIQLDPDELASRGVGIDEVANAVQSSNVNVPTGTLYGKSEAFTVETKGQLTDAAQYRPIVVTYRNGAPVRLQDLGRILDSVENDKVANWFDGVRSIVLAIQRQPGTNTVAVVDAIKSLLPRLRSQIPVSIHMSILFDRSDSIRASVDDVKFTLVLAVCLVVLVIFLFLRNVSATIIPSLALPMSIVGTFAAMYLLGYSLDNLSLMALTLSVGFVVDDAIVMLENIVRHVEMGEDVRSAAFRGSSEVGFTVLSMTLSLAAVFIPVVFMGGIVGRLLHEFAVTIAVAILISGFVSLTLTPMLCSRFLRSGRRRDHGRWYRTSERVFDTALHEYDRSLGFVLRYRGWALLGSLALVAVTVVLFIVIPKGFIPSEDNGMIFGYTEGPQGISFASMAAHQEKVNDVLLADPYVASFSSSVGGGNFGGPSNSGYVFLRLKPRSERPSVDEVIEELRPKLTAVAGIQTYLQGLPPIRVGGLLTKSQYQYTLQSSDTDALYGSVPPLESQLRALPMLQDVTSDLQITNPQATVDIDRDEAATLGVSVLAIEQALYTAYGSRQVSTIYAPNNEYRVIMELEPRYQADPQALSRLYVRSSSGRLVPLSTLARVARTVGPLSIHHLGQIPAATVSFNLAPGVSLGDAVGAVENVGRRVLPSDVTASFQGSAEAFVSSVQGLGVLLIAAILVIYVVLGILYESFVHPVTILSALPPAGLGALLTLVLFGKDLDLYAFVGIIMLVGLVKKNGIMMIDFALSARREEGKDALSAIREGCLIRFRPIMMTTMAALMATLPIAIGVGAGADSRRSLGLAVVGGLVVSQLLTLYLTPVYFVYLDSLQDRLRRGFRRPSLSLGSGSPGLTVEGALLEPGRDAGERREVLVHHGDGADPSRS